MTNRLLGQKIHLDANVFIYAVEGDAQFAQPARMLLSMIEAGSTVAYTSEFTLAELLVLPVRQGNRKLVGDYEGLFGGETALAVCPVMRSVLKAAAEIRALTKQNLPDCIHAATSVLSGCKLVVSQDQGLKAPGLTSILLSDIKAGSNP